MKAEIEANTRTGYNKIAVSERGGHSGPAGKALSLPEKVTVDFDDTSDEGFYVLPVDTASNSDGLTNHTYHVHVKNGSLLVNTTKVESALVYEDIVVTLQDQNQ